MRPRRVSRARWRKSSAWQVLSGSGSEGDVGAVEVLEVAADPAEQQIQRPPGMLNRLRWPAAVWLSDRVTA